MKSRRVTLLLIAACWAFALAVYPRLHGRIPVHWNLRGEANGWGPPASAFLFPAIGTATALLLWVLPYVDPRRRNWRRFGDEVNLFASLLVLFSGWVEVVALSVPLGWNVDVGRAVIAGVGGLIAVMGNYLPRIHSNWYVGIRTPWTLESEHVWRETHRVGGRTFVACGVFAVLAAALLPTPLGQGAAVVLIMAGGMVPVVYSYLLWRREPREDAR